MIADLGIRVVWLLPQIKALFDVRVTDADAPSYMSRSVADMLVATEEEKKYLTAAEACCASFSSSMHGVTVAGALGHGAVFLSHLVRLSSCWDKSFGEVFGWIKA